MSATAAIRAIETLADDYSAHVDYYLQEGMQPLSFLEWFESEASETDTDIPANLYLAHCEHRRATARTAAKREFWSRLAGSVRKAAQMI